MGRFQVCTCALSLVVVSLTVPLARLTSPSHAASSRPTAHDISFATPAAPAPSESANARTLMSRLPARFERHEEKGGDVAFIARGYGHQLQLSCDEAVLAPAQGERAPVRMRVVGAQRCTARGEGARSSSTNYFIGSDPTQWRTNVPSYEKARFNDVYPGIDLVYYGTGEHLEYDFIVAPGASPDAIRLSFEGVDAVRVDRSGELVVTTHMGDLRQHAPVVYQTLNGRRRSIHGSYAQTGEFEVAFAIDAYETDLPVVIDPVLVYSTYFGGALGDYAGNITHDADGNLILVGFTRSMWLPGAGGYQPENTGRDDAFIMKLNRTGSAILWTTFLGGSGSDYATEAAVGPDGDIHIAGATASADFPSISGSYHYAGMAGDSAVYVAKLSGDGARLRHVVRMAGSVSGMTVNAAGEAYVVGTTREYAVMPIVSAAQPQCGRSSAGYCSVDAYVWKLNATGTSLIYATYIGGAGSDYGGDIAVDAEGAAYVLGSTLSGNFPLASASQSMLRGPSDLFVTKIAPSGTSFVMSTYLGGSSTEFAHALAIDGAGALAIGAESQSRDFPGAAPYGGAFTIVGSGVVSVYDTSDRRVVFSGYIGAGSIDDVAFEASGNVLFAGTTEYKGTFTGIRAYPENLAVLNGYLNILTGRFSASGVLDHLMFVGGMRSELYPAIDVTTDGLWLTATTGSTDFPTVAGIYSGSQATIDTGGPDTVLLKFKTSLSISSAPQAAASLHGDTVDLVGFNFMPGATVRIGSSSPIDAIVVNPTRLTFQAPAAPEGVVDVTVVNPDGESAVGIGALRYCDIGWSVASTNFSARGAAGEVKVRDPNGCGGAVFSTEPWLRLTSSGNGADGAVITFAVDPNPGQTRLGYLTIRGARFAVWQNAADAVSTRPGDFTGDAIADLAVFRRSDATWHIAGHAATRFGAPGDIAIPGNYIAGGATERAVFRRSSGTWMIEGTAPIDWGLPGDVPVPADYDGDGTMDIAVFRPGTGRWYVRNQFTFDWGRPGDLAVPADYNGDGRAEIAVFRPATGRWWIAGVGAFDWGLPGDIPAPADYDGDGRVDIAVFRPSNGTWYVRGQFSMMYGRPGDIPLPLDYDGDGRANIAVYRPSAALWFIEGRGAGITVGTIGDVPAMFRFDAQLRAPRDLDGDRRPDLTYSVAENWTLLRSAAGAGTPSVLAFGTDRDLHRVADFDGDGRGDLALFRPYSGMWYVALSSSEYSRYTTSGPLGAADDFLPSDYDLPVPADYDGDGRADIAVYRPANNRWYVERSSDGVNLTIDWPAPGGVPVPADYDGDGRTDLALFDLGTGTWRMRKSSDNSMFVIDWGISTDFAVPADYDGDGRADIAVYRPSTGDWWIRYSTTDYSTYSTIRYGADTVGPLPGDYDGDGRAEPAYFRPGYGLFSLPLGRVFEAPEGTYAVAEGEVPFEIGGCYECSEIRRD
jgi:hypothetical protein